MLEANNRAVLSISRAEQFGTGVKEAITVRLSDALTADLNVTKD
jgi:hypothetical protein